MLAQRLARLARVRVEWDSLTVVVLIFFLRRPWVTLSSPVGTWTSAWESLSYILVVTIFTLLCCICMFAHQSELKWLQWLVKYSLSQQQPRNGACLWLSKHKSTVCPFSWVVPDWPEKEPHTDRDQTFLRLPGTKRLFRFKPLETAVIIDILLAGPGRRISLKRNLLSQTGRRKEIWKNKDRKWAEWIL